ncbi:MAG: DUF2505 domain-containing protein [Myxococcota bacterium]|nr:DUF2505 domain-containing protein [Myxococcota bacterium]
MKVRYEHSFPVSWDKLATTYANKEFYIQKQKSGGALSVDIVRWNATDKEITWQARISEKSRLPSFLRKDDVETYTDDSRLDLVKKVLSWKVTPSRGADKFFLSGRVEFRPKGNATDATFEIEMEVRVPLVGSKAEKLGLAESEKETARQAGFIRDWVTRA